MYLNVKVPQIDKMLCSDSMCEKTQMNTIMILRHGHFISGTEDLSSEGVKQVKSLLVKIQEYLEKSKTVILSSDAPRAVQSASLLSKYLKIPIGFSRCLWADDRHKENTELAVDTIIQYATQQSADVVIVVTHFEYTGSLPNLISQKITGKCILPHEEFLQEGEMYILKLDHGTYDVIESHRTI